jgi:hypothetical protein
MGNTLFLLSLLVPSLLLLELPPSSDPSQNLQIHTYG